MADWTTKAPKIRGWLMDITGVLYESGSAIPGSIEAIKKLREAKVPFRFVTNESTCTRGKLVEKLKTAGFELSENEVFAPAPAAYEIAKSKDMKPFLMVHPDAKPEFESFLSYSEEECNSVILGDMEHNFTYQDFNTAFKVLMDKQGHKTLISMGLNKFYSQSSGLTIDVGAFAEGLRYASDCKVINCGKPSPDFFLSAVKDLNLSPEEVLMIGDDIVSDVGGSQKCGLLGLQVRTGKFRKDVDEPHESVKPDGYVDNLAEAVNLFLKNRS